MMKHWMDKMKTLEFRNPSPAWFKWFFISNIYLLVYFPTSLTCVYSRIYTLARKSMKSEISLIENSKEEFENAREGVKANALIPWENINFMLILCPIVSSTVKFSQEYVSQDSVTLLLSLYVYFSISLFFLPISE